MKLALIYNIFEALDLAYLSIKNHITETDILIIVYQTTGNFGYQNTEDYDEFFSKVSTTASENNVRIIIEKREPTKGDAFHNEIEKRKLGLELAKQTNATHFLLMDCDEFYDIQAFKYAKEEIAALDVNACCGLVGYFKTPTLQFQDSTRVTFIQKLTKDVQLGQNRKMQYAFEGATEVIDTKRQVSHNDQWWSHITMHHFSHVRSNLEMKCFNSRANESFNAKYFKDYKEAKAGKTIDLNYCRIKDQELIEVENIFNIPDTFIDTKYA